MAQGVKIIMNSRYFHVAKPGEQANGKTVLTGDAAAGLIEYVGTRESVSLNFSDETAANPATYKQKELISNLLQIAPEAKNSFEYEDYMKNPTVKNASELISYCGEVSYNEDLDFDETANLVEYVAKRPGAVRVGEHGLFSDTPTVDLKSTMEEIATHEGNIWTHIISLRREDADRLGYDSQQPWRNLVMSHVDEIAKAHKISLNNFHWYAGMHNTGHHPHIHLFVYSDNPNEGYINKQGITAIKSAFAKDIFADDNKQIYVNKTELRDQIKQETNSILQQIEKNPLGQYAKETQQQLCEKLLQVKNNPSPGRAFYKYQSPENKKLIDEIQSLLVTQSPALSELYAQWCKEQYNLELTYQSEPDTDIPIEEQKTFYFIKNFILQAAINLDDEVAVNTDTMDMPAIEEQYTADTEMTHITNKNPDEPSVFQNNASNIDSEFSDLYYATVTNREAKDQYELARTYHKGINVEQEDSSAVMWYGLAAANGHGLAAYQLGRMYEHGIGTDQDTTLAKEYYLQAYYNFTDQLTDKDVNYFINTGSEVELGTDGIENKFGAYLQKQIGNMYCHGQGVEQNYEKARKWLELSAYNGNHQAQNQMTAMYLKGIGIEPDYIAVEKWLKLSANTGNTQAAYTLGKLYLSGEHLPKNEVSAFSYIKQSAEQGNEYAQYTLGRMYEQGTGTQVNYIAAKQQYELAVEQNNPYAQYALAHLYVKQFAVPKDSPEVTQLYQTALQGFKAEHNGTPSGFTAYRIAAFYHYGLGVEHNPELAQEWYKISQDYGNDQAQEQLDKLNAVQDKATPPQEVLSAIAFLSMQMGRSMRNNINDGALNKHKAVTDHKLKQEIQKKKIALGHSQKDHEQTQY